VKPDDVDMVNEYTCEAIKGTKDLHSIRSMGVMDLNKLMKKSLSCLCSFYVDDNFVAYDSLPWT
jgi:hypothetical protein